VIPKSTLIKLSRDKYLIMLSVIPVALLIIFSYIPMYGIVIAFQDYFPGQPFFSLEKWVGLSQFQRFFESPLAWRLIRNTFLLNIYSIFAGFPIPIIFALCLNELYSPRLRKVAQTISYLPHFISTVVICGLIVNMFSTEGGIINNFILSITGKKINFFMDPKYFRHIYVWSGIWQTFGWSSILYLSAIASIDPTLYQVAEIDGASRMQRTKYITMPGILPTISIVLILNFASLFSIGSEKVILLYNPAIYETADVISTYVYRTGLIEAQYSFGTAISLMNAIISLVLLFTFNSIAKKIKMATFL